jgi:alpha-tubulin suppressor-like RCC1 family protein
MRKRWLFRIALAAVLLALAACDAPWWPFHRTAVVEAVQAGGASAIALDDEGRVHTWGTNDFLGRESTATNALTPVEVSVSDVVSVAVGLSHMLVSTSDGLVYAWGYNLDGQLGTGSTADAAEPVQVTFTGLTGKIVAVSAGEIHSLALDDQGNVWAWGDNSSGQLGDGTYEDSSSPQKVDFGEPVVIVAMDAGNDASAPPEYYSLALDDQGNLWGWGSNAHDQLGESVLALERSLVPRKLEYISDVASVSAGWRFVVAVDQDGRAWAWGDGSQGALGDGVCGDHASYLPVAVMTDDTTQLAGVSEVSATKGGYQFTLALKTDGTVWAWGAGESGQLGDGTTGVQVGCDDASSYYGRRYAVQATGIAGVAAVSAGYYFSLAVKQDGTVWAWGDNTDGLLGVGSTDDYESTAMKVLGF